MERVILGYKSRLSPPGRERDMRMETAYRARLFSEYFGQKSIYLIYGSQIRIEKGHMVSGNISDFGWIGALVFIGIAQMFGKCGHYQVARVGKTLLYGQQNGYRSSNDTPYRFER